MLAWMGSTLTALTCDTDLRTHNVQPCSTELVRSSDAILPNHTRGTLNSRMHGSQRRTHAACTQRMP